LIWLVPHDIGSVDLFYGVEVIHDLPRTPR
jgi:hypothetical protein